MKRKSIELIANMKVYKYPFFIILGGDTKNGIKGYHQREILNVIEPGDILLNRHDGFITNIGIPGYFSHASICTSKDEVIEMRGNGIEKNDILTFMDCDDIEVLRFIGEDAPIRRDKAVAQAKMKYIDKIQYDYEFDFDDSVKFSCTELVDFCYDYPGIKRSNGKWVSPDDIKKSEIFMTIWSKNG
jgi:hypothetical protein